MEAYLPISYLNDFVFCPRSIYFHQCYGRTEQRLYQSTDQTRGKAAHKTIDGQRYTSARDVLQGLDVYSEQYAIGGKIDLYHKAKALLVERKKKIKVIYDGYIYQLYAQYHCLTEMGYEVQRLQLYSLDDNRVYPIKTPAEDTARQAAFERLLAAMRQHDLNAPFKPDKRKCARCIYSSLCDVGLC